jgi:hypothetical protein
MWVSTEVCEPVLLDWDAFGQLDSVMDGKPARDGWAIVPWTVGRAGGFGVAVRVSGRFEGTAAPLLKATSRRWSGRDSSRSSLTGRSLPVLRGRSVASAFLDEYSVLLALCSVVHDDAAVRPRLDDGERAARLASDLSRTSLRFRAIPTGAGRDSTDIHVALRQAGFVHRYNRPLTDAGLPSVDTVVTEVVERLRANPYRQGRPIDRLQVEQIVRRDYLDVQPWPFAALVAD